LTYYCDPYNNRISYIIFLAILYDALMPRSKAKKYILNHSNDRIIEPIKPSYEHMKGKR